MPLSTNNNILAINVRRTLSRNRQAQDRQLETVGSGLRVKRAENDASGLVVSEGLRAQLSRLGQNVRNAETASDLLKVAEGSLATATSVLQRMRELAMQAANGHLTDRQREVLAVEYNQAARALDRMAQGTVYNKTILLAGATQVDAAASTAVAGQADTGVVAVALSGADSGTYTFLDGVSGGTLTLGNGLATQTLQVGTLLDGGRVAQGTKVVANFDRLGVEVTLAGDGAIRPAGVGSYETGDLDGRTIVVAATAGGAFQVGPSSEAFDQLAFQLPDLRSTGDLLDLDKVSLSSQPSAREAIGRIDRAIGVTSRERGDIGALLNRLDHTIAFSENEIESMTSSESTIRDADMARAATELARSEILQGTSQRMLSQAFATSRQALRLL